MVRDVLSVDLGDVVVRIYLHAQCELRCILSIPSGKKKNVFVGAELRLLAVRGSFTFGSRGGHRQIKGYAQSNAVIFLLPCVLTVCHIFAVGFHVRGIHVCDTERKSMFFGTTGASECT